MHGNRIDKSELEPMIKISCIDEPQNDISHGYIGGQRLVNMGGQHGQSSKLSYYPATVGRIQTPNKRFILYHRHH